MISPKVFSSAALAVSLTLALPALAADSYQAAVSSLKIAGGNDTCVSCFLEKYGPAETPKAFAVSKDGAFGARWKSSFTVDEVREAALRSCRKKSSYRPENPCVVFFENDKMVWKP